MKTRMIVPLLVVVSMALWSCTNDSTAPLPDEGAVSGTVKDNSSGAALQGVTVSVVGPLNQVPDVTTDDKGAYTIKFTVDSVAMVTVKFSRDRYRDTSVVVQVFGGATTDLTVNMMSIQAVTGGSGTPQSIAFLNAAPPELSVYGVGGKETAVLSWQVRDSLGNPVDAFNPATLNFVVQSPLGGGEYVSPATMTTDASGSASITFNSGTRAGVVQILASTTAGSRTITSEPVRMVIHGGFPDQAHFTIATTAQNFPAMGIVGERLRISVLVGDKYSNPAIPSAVYFSSSAGVIQGTTAGAITTADGQGSVDLISGNPAPTGPYAAQSFGDGYHYVIARTLGQGGVPVLDSVLLLWSGGAMIKGINPTTFDIPNSGSQTITFNVADELDHPLAAGTTIGVEASIPPPPTDGVQQNKVFLVFGNQGGITLPDVIFPGAGRTSFSMIISDGSWGIVDAAGTPVNVTITVSGPNVVAPISASISGVIH